MPPRNDLSSHRGGPGAHRGDPRDPREMPRGPPMDDHGDIDQRIEQRGPIDGMRERGGRGMDRREGRKTGRAISC